MLENLVEKLKLEMLAIFASIWLAAVDCGWNLLAPGWFGKSRQSCVTPCGLIVKLRLRRLACLACCHFGLGLRLKDLRSATSKPISSWPCNLGPLQMNEAKNEPSECKGLASKVTLVLQAVLLTCENCWWANWLARTSGWPGQIIWLSQLDWPKSSCAIRRGEGLY